MTYKELARIANVSVSTVSKALAGSNRISVETAEYIRGLVEKYGVRRPNYRRNRTSVSIAILVPEIISVNNSLFITNLIDILWQYGIEPSLHVTGFHTERYCRTIDLIREENCTDGIISMCVHYYPQKIDIPIVSLLPENQSVIDSVSFDIRTGILDAVQYLCELGHRNIGFIGEKNTLQKENLFREASHLCKLDVPAENFFISNKRFENIGYEAVQYYRSLPVLPTALIAAYDEIALGASRSFSECGIRVPEDISMIGINDIPSAEYSNVPLTTVRTYNKAVPRLAVKLLLEMIKEPKKHIPQNILIRCELIVRQSTDRPPAEES